jgi:hypothetical protein
VGVGSCAVGAERGDCCGGGACGEGTLGAVFDAGCCCFCGGGGGFEAGLF